MVVVEVVVVVVVVVVTEIVLIGELIVFRYIIDRYCDSNSDSGSIIIMYSVGGAL